MIRLYPSEDLPFSERGIPFVKPVIYNSHDMPSRMTVGEADGRERVLTAPQAPDVGQVAGPRSGDWSKRTRKWSG